MGDDNKEYNAVMHPMPATNKTLQAMRQLATFCSPVPTTFKKHIAMMIQLQPVLNWEGKEQMQPTSLDMSLETHVLEEGSQNP